MIWGYVGFSMLVSLHVKNLALIKETEVNFGEGLNILSGETGAGKSIIIGSINLALGARADKDMIRTGAEYALVELIFQVSDPSLISKIKELEIPVEDDGLVIIQRKIQPARSICKVCGETVTNKQIKDLAEILIDIHGQHEHQSLLYKKNHLSILDSFAGEDLEKVKNEIALTYREYNRIKKEINEFSADDSVNAKELSLAEFEYNEIEEAGIKPGEDDELEVLYKKMSHAKQIAQGAGTAFELTGDSNESAADQIGMAYKELKAVEQYDEGISELCEELSNIDSLLSDFNRSLSMYLSDMEFDDETFHETEERLNILNHLKLKFGGSLEKVLDYKDGLEKKIEKLQNADAYKQKLEAELKNITSKLDSLCKKASDIRKAEADKLSKDMIAALTDLNFLDVKFEIQVRPGQEFSQIGFDDVEFMISTNPGEPIKSLGNVASGGELSRIMLAIKTVLASRDQIPTMIFDEIDTGISGKTAWKVSEKMGALSKSHQIICITHLPQIAAMSDHHFKITKEAIDNSTETSINELNKDEIIDEMCRLLGGDEITEAVRMNAIELISKANTVKQ